MVVIKADNVHKKFRVYYDKGSSLKEKLISHKRNKYEDRWVLQGINLEIEKGDAIGLLGENGCGKSTFLKMLTRIMYPDKGSIEINGRVSSLIELGAGFHPDLSGIENIYTNASIFGLTKKEIDKQLQNIIEFSELGEFLDNPVRTYSSGMYMRLAFSVAINVNADILLIDEILAVGDANFQAKCLAKLRELKANGVTIVIVSHDTNTIASFCNKAAWINKGKVVSFGKAKDVAEDYRQYMNEKMIASIKEKEQADNNDNKQQTDLGNENCEASTVNSNRFGLRYIEITKVIFNNKDGHTTIKLQNGQPVNIDIYYKVNKPLEEYNFGMGFYTMDDLCIYGVNTQLDGITVKLDKKEGFIRFKIPELELLTGTYYFQVAVVDINGTAMDYYRKYIDFEVVSNKKCIGITNVNHQWEIN